MEDAGSEETIGRRKAAVQVKIRQQLKEDSTSPPGGDISRKDDLHR